MISQRRIGSATSSYYGSDQTGNVRLLTDSAGAVTDRYMSKAFGEELSATGSTANPYRFGGTVGYYRDTADRLYVRARHYQSSQGRWLSRDPIGFEGGDFNLYRYVGNNPVNQVDPEGLSPVIIIGGVVVGAEALEAAAAAFGISIAACLSSPPCRDAAVQASQASINASIQAAQAAAKTIADTYERCKNTRCKVKDEGPHHYFTVPRLGIPPWKKCWMRHIQLICYTEGAKGTPPIINAHFPYGPCYKYKHGKPPVTH